MFALLLVFPFVASSEWLLDAAFFGLMYAALAVSWNIIGGYGGYVWLGLISFYGVGAYGEALAFQHSATSSAWLPLVAAVPIGLGAGLVAIPLGLLLLRVRGAVFAVVSLALLFLAEIFASNLSAITHGAEGMGLPTAPGGSGPFALPFYLAMLALVAGAMLVSWTILRSRLGLTLLAIRSDEERARGLGAPTTTVKLVAFCASCALAAMIGAVWADYIGFIYPIFAFSANTMFAVVMMVYLGGRGTLWGPFVGALLVAPAQEYLAFTLGQSQLYLIAYAVVFLVVIRWLPRGIVPTVRDFATRRVARRRVSMGEGEVVA
ncbi:MAG: branched-chain amino acid ABC transporter permease [Candidatus Dormibacteria bacterium]